MSPDLATMTPAATFPGFHTEGGGGGGGGGGPPQNFESLCTILYGLMVLGDFSWSFD